MMMPSGQIIGDVCQRVRIQWGGYPGAMEIGDWKFGKGRSGVGTEGQIGRKGF